MLSYSVQPTPLRWIWIGVPTGPDAGVIDTMLVSVTKNVRPSVVSPLRRAMPCRPPRSSGMANEASMRPSAPTFTASSGCSCGSKPEPLTRLPT